MATKTKSNTKKPSKSSRLRGLIAQFERCVRDDADAVAFDSPHLEYCQLDLASARSALLTYIHELKLDGPTP